MDLEHDRAVIHVYCSDLLGPALCILALGKQPTDNTNETQNLSP